MKIFYPYSEVLPSEKARALQVINTAHALASVGAEVELYAGFKMSDIDILNIYGLKPIPHLNFVQGIMLREWNIFGIKISWGRIFYTGCMRYLKRKRNNNFIIFTRHLKLAEIFLKKFPQIPLVYEMHEIFSMKRHSLFPTEKFVLQNAKGLISISRGLIKKAGEYFPLSNKMIKIIPDGVNCELIREVKKKIIPGDVVYVGHLYAWKGVDVLIHAMKYLPENRLTIVGGGSKKEKERIEQLVETLRLQRQVKLTGFLPYQKALRYMAGAKVLVLPLRDEMIGRYFTSPLKLFEYMACGIPIVASDLPTVREILSHGENALLVPPGDARAWADAISRILKDDVLAKRLSENAYDICGKYSWRNRAHSIIKLFERIQNNNA